MASTLVGALRVILSADAALFSSGLDEAGNKLGLFGGKLGAIKKDVADFNTVFKGLFVTGAIGIAAAKVLDYAGKIQDLSDQTGLATDSLQEMGYAAKQTGSDLTAFTNAAFKLGTNLADGTSKVQGAVEELGLSYNDLKAASPDEQFRQTAIALGKIENVQERNRLGVVVMGKAYKEVAGAINQGYDDLANKAPKSTAAQIKALADAGDEWDAFKDKVLNLGVVLGASFARAMESNITAFKQDAEFLNKYVGIVRITQQAVEDWKTIFGIAAQGPPILANAIKKNLPAALANQTLTMDEAEAKAKELDAQVAKSIETNKAAAKAAEEFAKALRHIGGAEAISGAQDIVRQVEAIGGPLKVLPSELKHLQEGLLDGAEAARLVGNINLAEKFERMAKALDPITVFQERYNVKIGEFVPLANSAADAADAMWEQFFRLSGQTQLIGPVLENKMILPWVKFKDAVTQNSPQIGKSFDNVGDAVKNMGNTILQAVTGGGNVLKALGSSFGKALGDDFVKNFGKSITGLLGKTIGGAVNAVLPGIGALLGPALEKIFGGFKKLFGIGANDDLKKFNAQIATSKDALLAQYGSLERIDRIGKIVGVDLAAAWKSQGEAGKKHFDELAKAFDDAINKMVDDAQKGVDDANSALSDLRGELDGAISDARDLGYEFDKTGKFTGVNFDKLKSKAEEFGVSVDGLGPAFRQQNIDAEAKRIIDGFELMAKAGGDVGGILFGMKDEIGKLVGKSIELGTTIPANMKPWIQNLIDTHQLLDENGKEITDISKIKFGEPVETQFEQISKKIGDLVGKIDALIDKITNELIPALEAATRDRNVHIGVTTDPLPNLPGTVAGGGGDERTGEPGTALGTKGRFGNWFHNWGHETANTMHGIEAVVRQDQAVPFAMDVLGGLGAGASAAAPAAQQPAQVHVGLENRIILDSREMKVWLRQTLLSAIDNNEDGIATDFRDALGVTP